MGKLRPREAKKLAQSHMPEYNRVRTKSPEFTSSSFHSITVKITVSNPDEHGIPRAACKNAVTRAPTPWGC